MEIETERLLLRQWRDSDLAPFTRIVGDDEVMRHMLPPRGMLPAEAAMDLEGLRAHWRRWGFGHWAVEERESGRLIGRTGLKRHPDWPLDPDNTECGWLYARSAWGKGYATEAAREVVRFAFEELGRPEVISIARPENAASRRVMEKAGLTLAGEGRWEARDLHVVWYSIRAEPGPG